MRTGSPQDSTNRLPDLSTYYQRSFQEQHNRGSRKQSWEALLICTYYWAQNQQFWGLALLCRVVGSQVWDRDARYWVYECIPLQLESTGQICERDLLKHGLLRQWSQRVSLLHSTPWSCKSHSAFRLFHRAGLCGDVGSVSKCGFTELLALYQRFKLFALFPGSSLPHSHSLACGFQFLPFQKYQPLWSYQASSSQWMSESPWGLTTSPLRD